MVILLLTFGELHFLCFNSKFNLLFMRELKMKILTRNKIQQSLMILLLSMGFTGCGSDNNKVETVIPAVLEETVTDPVEVTFSASLFNSDSANINHTYMPMSPGVTQFYQGLNDEGELERLEITVSHETKEIDGVMSRIVVDRVYVDDEMVEETFDWFAQDMQGNVWYMGEDSAEYEAGEKINNAGSWESGKDIDGVGENAIAGIIMKAEFIVGDSYQQEFYQGVAEDMAKIDEIDLGINLADGTSYTTVKILEWNPLDPENIREFKYFTPDIGLILEEKEDGSERIEFTDKVDQKQPHISEGDFSNSTIIDHEFFPLTVGSIKNFEIETEDGLETIVVEVTPTTRNVMGIETRVVRDIVYLDGVIIEDTKDWFAQDNDGNVWYFGEEVINYEYDDDGNLISTDNEGAWEAGIDGAQPGIQMPALLRIGDSFRQEFRAGEAEDIGAINALNVMITLLNGTSYNTLKTKEWNPLDEESGVEYKYYAAGIGLVREEGDEGFADLTQIMP